MSQLSESPPGLTCSLSSPEAVQNVPVRENPQHDVVCGGVVDEGPLGMDEEHVRNPYFLHQAPVEGHAFVSGAREGQPLILPVVPQIQSHGEVLRAPRRKKRGEQRSSLRIKCHHEDSPPLVY